ncbi:MAG: ABC transporter substrate-binding protein [Porticoccaceae bacterium]|nr:ABC transporter substrate-binding protein [Porticoccaceae bacterium]
MCLKGLKLQLLSAAAALSLVVPLSLAVPLDKKSILRQQYEPIISSVSKQLLAKHEIFKKDPSAYQAFLDQYVRPYWDVSSTSRALIGGKNFIVLDKKHQLKLVDSVDKTLVRYAFEGIDFYSGQQFTLVDVAISDSGKMGWVQVVIKSKILPDLNLDILVKRNKKGVWKAVDVRLKGITYVAVKKYQFKKILKKQGVGALITSLDEKNNKFFSELCKTADKVNKVDKQFC